MKMKRQFSKHWKSSKQSRKQRKYRFEAPVSIKRKMMSSNLSKELRKKYGKRNMTPRKGDTVRVMVGKFRNQKGKISDVNLNKMKILIENLQVQKKDGSKVNIPFEPSNLQIVEIGEEKDRIKKEEKK